MSAVIVKRIRESLLNCREDAEDEEERLQKSCKAFRKHLQHLNNRAADEMAEDIRHALHNIVANVRYHHIEEHGPHLEEVTVKNPLVPK